MQYTRPSFTVTTKNPAAYAKGWERIFGEKKKKPEETPEKPPRINGGSK